MPTDSSACFRFAARSGARIGASRHRKAKKSPIDRPGKGLPVALRERRCLLREQIAELMDAIAKREQRDGETFYDAYSRLLEKDAVFKQAYALYSAKGA